MEYGAVLYPSIAMPVGDPTDWVEPAYYESWQNQPTTLMPIYDLRFTGGDIANMPVFFFQLFANIHFGPDGTDDFQGPDGFDILEGPATFEIRTPE